ncbi:tripartite tricarboxylate transporter permease, partial [Methanoculleus chikugoensis]|uniref:tripartite tricarboxylate transporter permease n=1 Tax=Methanoculleus chikugoensis TaxID=118126 RepID=UPI001FB4C63A
MLGTAVGIGCGAVSGLVPGIHANTVAGVLLSLQALLLAWFDPVFIASAMFSTLVTHTFLDNVPGTFLGIPDADTSLAVLPPRMPSASRPGGRGGRQDIGSRERRRRRLLPPARAGLRPGA